MAKIEIDVGELHSNLHEQLSEMLEDNYEVALRQNVEDFVHDAYRQVERAQEQQSDAELKDVDLDE